MKRIEINDTKINRLIISHWDYTANKLSADVDVFGDKILNVKMGNNRGEIYFLIDSRINFAGNGRAHLKIQTALGVTPSGNGGTIYCWADTTLENMYIKGLKSGNLATDYNIGVLKFTITRGGLEDRMYPVYYNSLDKPTQIDAPPATANPLYEDIPSGVVPAGAGGNRGVVRADKSAVLVIPKSTEGWFRAGRLTVKYTHAEPEKSFLVETNTGAVLWTESTYGSADIRTNYAGKNAILDGDQIYASNCTIYFYQTQDTHFLPSWDSKNDLNELIQ